MGFPLYHTIRKSSLTEQAPLLIMMHGYGSDENDLLAFASDLPKAFFILSLRGPYPVQPHGYSWYDLHIDAQKGLQNNFQQAEQSCLSVREAIDTAIASYPVDKNNVSLLGFSQGSILSYAIALRFPQKIRCVVALSGYFDKILFPKDISKMDYSKLDVYSSHGTMDPVIPVALARQTPTFLKNLNISCKYSEFQSGHNISIENFKDLKDWLVKKAL